MRFNPPPEWPVPQDGWQPPPDWMPDPSWPPPPPGWQFWVADQPHIAPRHRPAVSPAPRGKESSSSRRRSGMVVAAVLVLVLGAGGFIAWSRLSSTASVASLIRPGEIPGKLAGFLPDGTLVAVDGKQIRFWDTATIVETRSSISDPSPEEIRLSKYGDRLAVLDAGCGATSLPCDPSVESGGEGSQIRLYDVASGQLSCVIDQSRLASDVAFEPTGSTVVITGYGEDVTRWNVDSCSSTGILITFRGRGPSHLDVSPDGTIAGTFLRSLITVWNPQSPEPPTEIDTEQYENILGTALRPDGSTLATASLDGTVRLWNLATGQQVGPALNHLLGDSQMNGGPTSVSFSPDGKTLAVAGQFDGLRLWDVMTGRQLTEPTLPDVTSGAVAFSPTTGKLAFGTHREVSRKGKLLGYDSMVVLTDTGRS